MIFVLSEAQRHLVTGKDQLLWLQVINRAARSVGDKGTESFRMKDADEIHNPSLQIS